MGGLNFNLIQQAMIKIVDEYVGNEEGTDVSPELLQKFIHAVQRTNTFIPDALSTVQTYLNCGNDIYEQEIKNLFMRHNISPVSDRAAHCFGGSLMYLCIRYSQYLRGVDRDVIPLEPNKVETPLVCIDPHCDGSNCDCESGQYHNKEHNHHHNCKCNRSSEDAE